jgi:two-component system, sensor histidine kinase and response regulator
MPGPPQRTRALMFEPEAISRKPRILFVDDEEKSRKYFAILFGKTWDIQVARDGAEALDILSGDSAGEIGIVVTDQIMPRMTGIQMLDSPELRNAALVRVLSTAYTDSELVSNAVQSGLIDYFVGKPWSIDKLRTVLETATAHHELMKKTGRRMPPHWAPPATEE